MDNNSNPLAGNAFPRSDDLGIPVSLSELAWTRATHGHSRKKSWRETHGIDSNMRTTFEGAANIISEQNRLIHRGSFKLNIMITINTGTIARRDNVCSATVQSRMVQNVRNLYRDRPHRFMGIWRREAKHGDHFHMLIHAPRQMRAILIERVPDWLSDPVDPFRTSRHFNRRTWQAVALKRTWHMCRVYSVSGALDYIAKVPKGPKGELVYRKAITAGAREFGIIGLSNRRASDRGIEPVA